MVLGSADDPTSRGGKEEMNTLLFSLLAFLLGAAVGQFYFGGLWLTVKRLSSVRSPGLLAFGSFVIRTGLAVFCFYLIASTGHWERVLASVVGFAAARWILVMRLRPGEARGLCR
jgi:F1F0 ATPase subunit 2